MNTQKIKNALHELEPEEAARIAQEILRDAGYVIKVWSRDDISSTLDQEYDSLDLTEEDRERVIDLAVDDSTFQNLEDATEYDWNLINLAIECALAEVRS